VNAGINVYSTNITNKSTARVQFIGQMQTQCQVTSRQSQPT